MIPDTGEIVAAANVQRSSESGAVECTTTNLSAIWTYEPGSIIKPLTMSAVLESGAATPHELLQLTETYPVADRRLERARDICARKPELDFHNVWHTLTLLELAPIERLEGSLRRGRGQID